MEILFAALGIVLALLDGYVVVSHRGEASPNVVTIALPALIAAGSVTRPARERVSILSPAVMLALWLNRSVVTRPSVVHGVVLAGAVLLIWRAYRSPIAGRAAANRLLLAACTCLAGFLLAWLWRL